MAEMGGINTASDNALQLQKQTRVLALHGRTPMSLYPSLPPTSVHVLPLPGAPMCVALRCWRTA